MPAYGLMYTPRQVVVRQTGLLTQQDKRLVSDRLTQAAASAAVTESVRKPESTLNKWEIRETLDYALSIALCFLLQSPQKQLLNSVLCHEMKLV